ncbi:MAG: NADH-quinone oxidoreductase subunit L, partial [Gammaproteobacteria bacterium]
LIGFPGFSGFFSKDGIIEAVHHSTLPGSGIAYAAVLIGVFITALYSFRMFFLVFHTEERMDAHTREHLHETSWVVTGPLIALAIPSVIIGYLTIGPVLFGGYFGEAIFVLPAHDVLGQIGADFHGPLAFMLHGLMQPPFWLAMAGLGTAWYVYTQRPQIAEALARRFPRLHGVLLNKYGFDDFNEAVFAGGSRGIGTRLWQGGDVGLIDNLVINGSASAVGWFAGVARRMQSGYLYHYAFAMIIGLVVALGWFALG